MTLIDEGGKNYIQCNLPIDVQTNSCQSKIFVTDNRILDTR